MTTIRVSLGPRSYDIAVDEPGGIGPFAATRLKGRRAYVFADYNVAALGERTLDELGRAGITGRLATIPPGEASKSIAQLAVLYERLAQARTDRQTAVVAVGGGVVGDLAGFAAATYNRGLPLVMVPTTLLAMVDSSVGGKVGINLPAGKNLVGAFHQPAGVWIETATLTSLSDRDYRAGLAEVVKYGMILDADFFAWLESNADAVLARDPAAVARVVARSCELKAGVVAGDEREETGLRAVLNFGHTFAHAFETAAGSDGRHGEAVAAGMACAARLAERRRMIPADVTARLIGLLTKFGLPSAPPAPPRPDEWLDAMRRDKKAVAGRLRFVLPHRIGAVDMIDDIPEDAVRDILTEVGP
jgi:3-dehydroquinate synthase